MKHCDKCSKPMDRKVQSTHETEYGAMEEIKVTTEKTTFSCQTCETTFTEEAVKREIVSM